MAEIIGTASTGVDPAIMGIGPITAIQKCLDNSKLSLDQIDLIELNEAFAAQSLAVCKELNLNQDIINVNGGAIALGHPVGASGARILVTLIHEMQKTPTDLWACFTLRGRRHGSCYSNQSINKLKKSKKI